MTNKKSPKRAAIEAVAIVVGIAVFMGALTTLFVPMLFPMDSANPGEIDYSQITPEMVQAAQTFTTLYTIGTPLLCLAGIIAPIAAYHRAKRALAQPDNM
ncbi:MAG: hypothetical protein H6668_00345 [Ardenticatenaceae bacterium]|nr:hypothetical protein [Ardenticatenaceae bacterium]